MHGTDVPRLDDAVRDARVALEEHGLPRPDALFYFATGSARWAERLDDAYELELDAVPGLPERWRSEVLRAGKSGPLTVWALDDVAGEPHALAEPRWASAFPVWLAADAGASLCVHVSAGRALAPRAARGPRCALLRDHLDLSGGSPLVGLGESRLGPLFPDQSRVHHVGLRRAAATHAERIGLDTFEAVAACTQGPALETPAELDWLASAGADVAVQSLAPALIACAHAGLACLALVAALDRETLDVARLVEQAAQTAPALEELVGALTRDLFEAACVRRAEEGA